MERGKISKVEFESCLRGFVSNAVDPSVACRREKSHRNRLGISAITLAHAFALRPGLCAHRSIHSVRHGYRCGSQGPGYDVDDWCA